VARPRSATTPAISSGLVDVAPVQVGRVRRHLGDQLPDAVQLGVAQPRVGVRLQGALRLRAVALVLEVVPDAASSSIRETAGTWACFM
jgi:hypothetical protein